MDEKEEEMPEPAGAPDETDDGQLVPDYSAETITVLALLPGDDSDVREYTLRHRGQKLLYPRPRFDPCTRPRRVRPRVVRLSSGEMMWHDL